MLSPEGRFEIANRPGVEAPSDLRMRADARGTLAELYGSITNEIFRRTPGAAITEYVHVLGRHVPAREVRDLGYVDAADRTIGSPVRWTLTRIWHRYGTNLDDDLVLRRASPLRLSRQWRWPQLRNRAPAGESAFHVQHVVEHNTCADADTQRRIARRFVTAESLWEARGDLWPGQVLRDPIPLLGIEPGSRAPSGWPPPPPPSPPPAPSSDPSPAPAPVSVPERPQSEVQEAPQPRVAPPNTRNTNGPAAPPARSWYGCAASPRTSSAALAVAMLGLVAMTLRRRRDR